MPLASAAASGRDLRGRAGSSAARVGGRAGAARTRQGSSSSEGFSQRLRGAGDFAAVCLRRRIAPLPLQLYSRGHRQRQTATALKRSRKGISVPSQPGMALPPPATIEPCKAEKTF